MKDFVADAYMSMLEMTNIYKDDDISATDMHNDMSQMISKIHHLSHAIGKNHYAVRLSNGNMYFYHKDADKIHSASLFIPDNFALPNAYSHVLASKGDAKDASGIYKNIQFMLDNGKTVTSDTDQTRGGRNLWRNIHKHVKFNKVSLHDIDTGKHVKDVENFEELSKTESDPYIYTIKK